MPNEKNRPVFVCRAMDEGLWIPGSLRIHEKVCFSEGIKRFKRSRKDEEVKYK